MNRFLPSLLVLCALPVCGWADDRLRDVQVELKSQGFYFGEADGMGGSETTAALRRFQIRNGLEVTGTLTDETIKALGVGVAPGGRVPQEAPPAVSEEPAPPADEPGAPAPRPPVNLRRDETVQQKDRDFLRQGDATQRRIEPRVPPPYDPSVVPAPRPLENPTGDLSELFVNTPYGNAPREVQEDTLRRAQGILASRGLYRAAIDGETGPATEEAILTYQRSARLPLTGRLDLETLSRLNLLPGRAPIARKAPPIPEAPPPGQRIYRGIWIR